MAMTSRERGSALVVSLIFLLLFLIMALTVYRGSLTSAQVIGNMQWRNEAIASANEAIDRLLSLKDGRIATEALLVTQEVNAAPFPYDVNADGKPDLTVSFPPVTLDGLTRPGPRCLRAAPVPVAKLDPDKEEDAGCFVSSSSGGLAVEGAGGTSAISGSSAVSLCSNSEWTMTVRATDPTTSTSVDVIQGFAVRVPTVAIPVCN
jgi:hypothetical protein